MPTEVRDRSRIKELKKQGWKTEPKVQPLATSQTQPLRQTLNVNTATLNELKAITGVGVAKAKAIIENQPNLTKEKLVELVADIDWGKIDIDGVSVELKF